MFFSCANKKGYGICAVAFNIIRYFRLRGYGTDAIPS